MSEEEKQKRMPIVERLQNKKEVVPEIPKVADVEIMEWKKKASETRENIKATRIQNLTNPARPKTPRIMSVKEKVKEIESLAPPGTVKL